MRILLFFFPLFLFFLQVNAQKSDTFQPGYYFDTNGVKHEGLIMYKYHSNKNNFKYKTHQGSKTSVLAPQHANSFVVAADSFFVLTNFYTAEAYGVGEYIAADYVQMVEPGPLTLVKYYWLRWPDDTYTYMGGEGYLNQKIKETTYYLIEAPSQRITSVRSGEKEFKESMSFFFREYPDLVQKIEIGAYQWKDMPEIVTLYNQKKSNL